MVLSKDFKHTSLCYTSYTLSITIIYNTTYTAATQVPFGFDKMLTDDYSNILIMWLINAKINWKMFRLIFPYHRWWLFSLITLLKKYKETSVSLSAMSFYLCSRKHLHGCLRYLLLISLVVSICCAAICLQGLWQIMQPTKRLHRWEKSLERYSLFTTKAGLFVILGNGSHILWEDEHVLEFLCPCWEPSRGHAG